MMNKKDERLKKWASELSEEEAKTALAEIVGRMTEIEEINFRDDNIAPYWESCGEPVIEGQDCFID